MSQSFIGFVAGDCGGGVCGGRCGGTLWTGKKDEPVARAPDTHPILNWIDHTHLNVASYSLEPSARTQKARLCWASRQMQPRSSDEAVGKMLVFVFPPAII
ncbi:hypothetical protein [Paraburkholderia sp. 2C]